MKFSGITKNQEKAIAELLPMLPDRDIFVEVRKGDCLSIVKEKEKTILTYSVPSELYNGLTRLSANGIYKRSCEMMCYMADCSRNAVLSIDGAKKLIRYLALMGYDSLMLYTEDTYEVPGYPYFGLMRGRYSEEELKELVAYGELFGIELIPCIQTLAHLASALRWPTFDKIHDIDDIMLIGEEKTYEFIDACIAQCRKVFKTNKINIGMDEAHHVGRGKYLTKNGYQSPADLMTEHLNRVLAICKKYNFKPMMWSDMFFRMCWDGAYYSDDKHVDKEVIQKVSPDVSLIYWDYYSVSQTRVNHMMAEHKRFKNDIVFAGGGWKWYGFGAQNGFSIPSAKLQMNGCSHYKIKRVIVTGWGDNGGESSQFSNLASLLYYSERSYHRTVSDKMLNKRCREIFGVSLEKMMAFDLLDNLPGCEPEKIGKPVQPGKYLLYNDIFERIYDCHFDPKTAPEAYRQNAEKLKRFRKNHPFGYALHSLEKLNQILAVKCDMGYRLHDAYVKNDKKTMELITEKEIPQLVRMLDEFIVIYRKQWLSENKPNGLITQDIRLGGLRQRLISCQARLREYLAGNVSEIPELLSDPLPLNDDLYTRCGTWMRVVNAGIL